MTPYSYLLDTNIVSDLVRHPQGMVSARLARIDETALCTSIIVTSELRFGAFRSGSARLMERVELILSELDTLPLEAPVDQHYAAIRTHLERIGQPIGSNDLLIAAHALALDLTLVTDNVREFSRVPGLIVENWLAL